MKEVPELSYLFLCFFYGARGKDRDRSLQESLSSRKNNDNIHVRRLYVVRCDVCSVQLFYFTLFRSIFVIEESERCDSMKINIIFFIERIVTSRIFT